MREHDAVETAALGPPRSSRAKLKSSKKDRILDLYRTGVTNVGALAREVDSNTSYVAQVLTEAGLLSGYFDLYTTSQQLMNFHSQFSRGIVRFKTPEDARASVERIDQLYRDCESHGDRAGQHHAQVMALIGFNRALSLNKVEEARLFADWLIDRLTEVDGLSDQMPLDQEPATSEPEPASRAQAPVTSDPL
jgi:hypothetical protein